MLFFLRKISFKKKLTILVSFAIFIPLVISGFLAGSFLHRHFLAMHTTQLQTEIKTLSLLLSQRQSELTQGIQRVASDNTLQVTLDLEILPQLSKYLNYQADTIHFTSLMVTDSVGQIIDMTGDRNSVCFDKNVPQLFVDSFFVGLCHSSIIKRNDKTLGYLIGEMSLSDNRFKQYLHTNLVNNYIIWIDGKPLISDLNFPKDKDHDFPVPSETISDFQTTNGNFKILSKQMDFRGSEVFISSLLPLTSYNAALQNAVVTILISSLALFLIILFVLNRFIIDLTRPIIELTAASDFMKKGKYHKIKLDLQRPDEFGLLNVAFSNMSKSLQDNLEEMEELVLLRTAELHEINKALENELGERKQAQAAKEKLVEELQTALNEIKTLHGIIPICSYCKKIRSDEGAWTMLEEYFSYHTNIDFTHGICPECKDDVYSDFVKKIAKK